MFYFINIELLAILMVHKTIRIEMNNGLINKHLKTL